MTTLNRWGRITLFLALPAAACSTVVGADFDGLGPSASGGSSGSGGAALGGNAGAGGSNGGAAGSAGRAPGGGEGGDLPLGQAGSHAGSPSGGVGGAPVGGSPPEGGAEQGGVGNAGESAGGAGGDGGAENLGVPPTAVVLNELKGQGPNDDYIELYNPGDETADLSGAYVADDSGNRTTFPPGATIASHGFAVIRLKQLSSTGMVTTCFGFKNCYDGLWGVSAKGENVSLNDSKGVLLDQLTYPSEDGPNNVGNGNSFGRIPDGADTTGPVLISPGGPNNSPL